MYKGAAGPLAGEKVVSLNPREERFKGAVHWVGSSKPEKPLWDFTP